MNASSILLVEDNADSRESLRVILESYGHQVVTAADGVEGVRKAVSSHPRVAIVDIGLPQLTGYEVARQVRANLGDGIFLIALTAYNRPEDRRRCREAGFDVHLSKPADLDPLLQLLRQKAPPKPRPAPSTIRRMPARKTVRRSGKGTGMAPN